MLCDICGKKTAKIIITEIRNGEKREQHLCEDCAADNKSLKINMPNLPGDISLNIGNLLSFAMMGAKNMQKKPGIDAIESHACPNCGVTFSEFKKSGKFGCEKCYEAFGAMLPITLTSIQPGTVHTGKKPLRMASEKDLDYVPGEERSVKGAHTAESASGNNAGYTADSASGNNAGYTADSAAGNNTGYAADSAAGNIAGASGNSAGAFENSAAENTSGYSAGSAELNKAKEKAGTAAAAKSVAEKIELLKKEIDELRGKLKTALEVEDYEEAARLRDLIKAKTSPQKTGAVQEKASPRKTGAVQEKASPRKTGTVQEKASPRKTGTVQKKASPQKIGTIPLSEKRRKKTDTSGEEAEK